ncbi:carbamoyltransferase C-terminal domain-containing protein [Nonomuraea africana]|uniref:Carbamoyltransferase n=1 Tax=Nonomuraea africana TaxID=46171 RepID=A0ABR9KWR9_9ACTN|nr:carbamoyltransferase C-terminal domain-containing protein [Nonomuraea africana]MBE1566483.1 carbamoyltransferase [Nonomuraea africana]
MSPLEPAPRARPDVVLGLCSFTHDSAAALLVDGELVGFVEEERLSQVKHTRAYPEQAVAWLLQESGLTAEQVDTVAYNFHGPRYLADLATLPALLAHPASSDRALPRAVSFAKVGVRTLRRARGLKRRFPHARVRPLQHHRTHQMYAFAASGWERAAVVIADSLGETQTTTIAAARLVEPGRPALGTVLALRDPGSLGYAYGAVTEHLGWRRGDEEGTVMALAALGDPARFRALFERIIPITPNGFVLHPAYFAPRVLSSAYARLRPRFGAATCPRRRPHEPITDVHRDLAAALQERTEQVMLHLARLARDRTGERRLCVGGGVATNCVAIGKIIEAGLFEEVFVPPAPGDAGTAIGAAAAAHIDASARPLAGIAGACYLGPDFGGHPLDLTPWPSLAEKPVDGDAADFLADQLAAGLIVGLFHGRIEAGPRALGNRSILASPLQPDVVARLNDSVKFREPFRPFAPMVLAEHAADYFTLGQDAPFMSMASGVTDLARTVIPTVIHANDTARLQTVTKDGNPFVHAVLTAFTRRTGVPVLINTSLNVKGKPICGTPAMALDCLATSGLDALLLDGRWITK